MPASCLQANLRIFLIEMPFRDSATKQGLSVVDVREPVASAQATPKA